MENDIQHEIELFNLKRQINSDDYQEIKRLQQRFVSDFPINRIKKLDIDEYIIGKGSKDSYCYRLERELGPLGDMRGSTSSVFVVYYGKRGTDKEYKYRYTKKLGKAVDEFDALDKVKKEIIQLIKAGDANDRDAIASNRLADLFKFKILGTYYPEQFLNIYSKRHLDYFIGELGLNPLTKSIISKQDVLLEFKNENSITEDWSNYEFNSFLYNQFGRPPSKEEEQEKEILPPIEKIKPEIITLEITDYQGSDTKKRKGSAKPNYNERQKKNTKLGKRGENIVFNLEREFFKQNNFPLKELEHSSKQDDRLGYDIQSLDENREVKYIEVKSTRKRKGQANFIITENEKSKAEQLPNYFIYVVFEAHTTRPKIWKIKEPFKGLHDKFSLSPINYRVEITVRESS